MTFVSSFLTLPARMKSLIDGKVNRNAVAPSRPRVTRKVNAIAPDVLTVNGTSEMSREALWLRLSIYISIY